MKRTVLVCLLAWTWPAPAAAEDHPPLSLSVEPCEGVDASEVRRVVAIELRGSLRSHPDTGNATHARARCIDGDARLEVDDPLTGKSLQRTVRLQRADPRARARLLALAIVELVAASWSELALSPAPRAPVVQKPADRDAREAAIATVQARSPRLKQRLPVGLGVDGQARGLWMQGFVWWGTGLRVALQVHTHVRLSLGFHRHWAGVATELGDVDVAGWSGNLRAELHRRFGLLEPFGGLGVDGGFARLRGTTSDQAVTAAVASGPLAAVLAVAGVRAWLHHRLALELRGDLGYLLAAVRGVVTDGPAVSVQGVWASGAVALEVRL